MVSRKKYTKKSLGKYTKEVTFFNFSAIVISIILKAIDKLPGTAFIPVLVDLNVLLLCIWITKQRASFSKSSKTLLISSIIIISIFLNYSAYHFAAQPRSKFKGIIEQPNNIPNQIVEVNIIDPLANTGGWAVFPDGIGYYQLEGLRPYAHWGIAISFLSDYIRMVEFIANVDQEKEHLIKFNDRSNKYNRNMVGTVYFKFDSFTLTEESKNTLLEIASKMKNNPKYRSHRILIHGHCCDIGDADYNQLLGQRRGWKAREELISHGVNQNRIIVVSYGEIKPVSRKIRERNRRVECYLIPENDAYQNFLAQFQKRKKGFFASENLKNHEAAAAIGPFEVVD